MSKSLGNGIDPVEMVKKYGADAVRLALIIGTTPGNDTRLNEDKIENYRNFVNKLWNIARFILTTVEKPYAVEKAPKAKSLSDRWILSRFSRLITSVGKHLDTFAFSAAGEELYAFTWNELADWYVEDAKAEQGKDEILLYVLTNLLKLWQPFMPFVTQVLWQELPGSAEPYVITAPWPKANKKAIDEAAEKEYGLYQEIVTQIRNFRAEFKVAYTKEFPVTIITADPKAIEALQAAIVRKVRVSELKVQAKDRAADKEATLYFAAGKIYVPFEGLIDAAAEQVRLKKELDQVKKYIIGVEKKLSNQEFVKNAPPAVVAMEKQKMAEAQTKITSIESQLSMLA
jgi:valyl-tRNA synthetase